MKSALLVVDMQYDFIDGSLPVPKAWEIVAPIQQLVYNCFYERVRIPVYFSRCWHPINHCSFIPQGGKWPVHCVAGTKGAEIQAGLDAMAAVYGYSVYDKGTEQNKEEYSAMEIFRLLERLHKDKIEELKLCGLARNVCVEETAKAAAHLGYQVTVIEELCRSV